MTHTLQLSLALAVALAATTSVSLAQKSADSRDALLNQGPQL